MLQVLLLRTRTRREYCCFQARRKRLMEIFYFDRYIKQIRAQLFRKNYTRHSLIILAVRQILFGKATTIFILIQIRKYFNYPADLCIMIVLR